jgi:AcrR family transcriptional regulator
MTVSAQGPAALRADAARNRERIVAAAKAVFAERGLDASTAEIAQRAGVGEATLFRRFPHKEDLIDAILEATMADSNELIADCASDPDPARGLERFFLEILEKKMQDDLGYLEALHDRCMTNPRFEPQRTRWLEEVGTLARRAKAAGVLRKDVQPQDLGFLLMSVAATMQAPVQGVRGDLWKRYAGIVLDGLRPEGASPLRPAPPPRKVIESPAGS